MIPQIVWVDEHKNVDFQTGNVGKVDCKVGTNPLHQVTHVSFSRGACPPVRERGITSSSLNLVQMTCFEPWADSIYGWV